VWSWELVVVVGSEQQFGLCLVSSWQLLVESRSDECVELLEVCVGDVLGVVGSDLGGVLCVVSGGHGLECEWIVVVVVVCGLCGGLVCVVDGVSVVLEVCSRQLLVVVVRECV
jgi:hypothetical protein